MPASVIEEGALAASPTHSSFTSGRGSWQNLPVASNNDRLDPVTRKLNLVAVLLVGALAASLVIAQIGYTRSLPNISLYSLDQRANELSQITDPIQRDERCVQLSAIGRQLDKALAPDARVFISGMLGQTNAANLDYYYFLRNYLFPRDVEISTDTNLVFHEGWFEGSPYDSPEELKADGFDLLIRGDHDFELIPLTSKGMPKR